MAQTKISQLTELSSIADNDYLAGLDTSASTTKKVKMSTLKSYINTGDAQDVQINGTSVVSGNVANIAVEGIYNASTNKLETVNDVNSKTGTLSNLTTTNKTNLVSAINELNTNKEENSNKTDTLDENSTNTQYPSAKATYELNSTTKEDLENELSKTQAQLDTYKTIYNVLPKVNGTGENISLSNTGVAPLNMELKGNTSQISYNQVVKNGNFTNLNEWTIRQSNAIASNNEITLTHTSASHSSQFRQSMSFVVGHKYYFSCYAKTSDTNNTFGVKASTGWETSSDNSQTIISSINLTTSYVRYSNVITLNDNNTYAYLLLAGSEVENTTRTIKDVMLFDLTSMYGSGHEPTKEEFEAQFTNEYYAYSYGLSPNPSYPQTIQVVNGDNEVSVCGENLWSSIWEQGTIQIDDGQNHSSSTMIRTQGYIAVIPNQHYAIKRTITTQYTNVRGYNKNKEYIGSGSTVINLISGGSASNPMTQGQATCVISPKDNIYYLRFNDVSNDLSTKYMMVKGDTPKDYEPYTSSSYQVNLGDIELCKIGTYQDKFFKAINGNTIYDNLDSTIKDTLDYGEWYLEKNIGKVVLDGEEVNWTEYTNTASGLYKAYTISVKVGRTNDYEVDGYSNYFDVLNVFSQGSTYVNMALTKNATYLSLPSSIASSIESLRTWLGTHNTEIKYILATPTYTKIEGTLASQLDDIANATSYPTQTNISQISNNLPFIIDAQTLLDISNLENRVTLLED